MNRISGIALVVGGLVVLGQAGSAEASCKVAKGNFVEFWDGGGESPGTLSNAGWLNGTTLAVFNSEGYETPVSSAFTFTAEFTLATAHGELKGTRLFLTDVETGWSLDMTAIDPGGSTGIFAEATGVLYVNQIQSNTDPPPTSYLSEVKAVICFAPGNEPAGG